MAKLVSIQQIADRYGYTYQAVKKWVSEGLPIDTEKNKIPELEGTEWVVTNKIKPLREVSLSEEMQREKLREQKAKADLATIAVKEKSGELICVDIVQAVLNAYCQNFKDTMRLIPQKHSVEVLENADSTESVKQKLKELIDTALIEIGDLMVIDLPVLDDLEDTIEEQADVTEPDVESDIDLS